MMASSRSGRCCCCIPCCPEPPRPQNPLDFTGGKVLGFMNYDPDRPEAGPFITTLAGENIYPNKKEAKDGWGYVWTDADLAAMNQQEPLPCIDLLNFLPPQIADRLRRASSPKNNKRRKSNSPDRNCIQRYSPPYPPMPFPPGRMPYAPMPSPNAPLQSSTNDSCDIDDNSERNNIGKTNVEILDLNDVGGTDDKGDVREIKEFQRGFYKDRRMTEAIARNTHQIIQECIPFPVPCEEPLQSNGNDMGRPVQVVRQCEEFCSGIGQTGNVEGRRRSTDKVPQSIESEQQCEERKMGKQILVIRQCEQYCTGIKLGGVSGGVNNTPPRYSAERARENSSPANHLQGGGQRTSWATQGNALSTRERESTSNSIQGAQQCEEYYPGIKQGGVAGDKVNNTPPRYSPGRARENSIAAYLQQTGGERKSLAMEINNPSRTRERDSRGNLLQLLQQSEEYFTGSKQSIVAGQSRVKKTPPRYSPGRARENSSPANLQGGGQRKYLAMQVNNPPSTQERDSRGHLIEYGALKGDSRSTNPRSSRDSPAQQSIDSTGIQQTRQFSNGTKPNGSGGSKIINGCYGCPCSPNPNPWSRPHTSTDTVESEEIHERKKKRKKQEISSDSSSDDYETKSRPWYFQGLRYPAKKIRF